MTDILTQKYQAYVKQQQLETEDYHQKATARRVAMQHNVLVACQKKIAKMDYLKLRQLLLKRAAKGKRIVPLFDIHESKGIFNRLWSDLTYDELDGCLQKIELSNTVVRELAKVGIDLKNPKISIRKQSVDLPIGAGFGDTISLYDYFRVSIEWNLK